MRLDTDFMGVRLEATRMQTVPMPTLPPIMPSSLVSASRYGSKLLRRMSILVYVAVDRTVDEHHWTQRVAHQTSSYNLRDISISCFVRDILDCIFFLPALMSENPHFVVMWNPVVLPTHPTMQSLPNLLVFCVDASLPTEDAFQHVPLSKLRPRHSSPFPD